MFITKKHLSRRTLLRGVGATVALPLLDAMIPASTALANTAAAPRPRLGFFYLPHGFIMDRFTPSAVGKDFELSPILESLAPFKSHLTIVSGLDNKPASSSAVHAITPGTWLSAVPPAKSHAPQGGVSIDQIAARHIGQDTTLPSLEVATEPKGGSAACDGTYGCNFGNTIAFRTESNPLPMEYNPRKLFRKLFGQGDSAAERAAIANDYRSVLDMVMAESAALKTRLGARDQAVLDSYLESVREIERRVAKADEGDVSKLKLPTLPAGMPDFDGRVRLMFDMIALAYQANLTRIVTYMMAAEVSNQAYTHLEIPDAFHPLSHHNNDPRQIEKLVKLQRYHTAVFADFLKKLAATPDGEGSMLDNSILLYGSNMSDGNRHNNFPLPAAVLGRGCGRIKGNQHLKYPDRTPHANLLATLLDRAGVRVESVGNSTGQFPEV
jgi:hypothetical protein